MDLSKAFDTLNHDTLNQISGNLIIMEYPELHSTGSVAT